MAVVGGASGRRAVPGLLAPPRSPTGALLAALMLVGTAVKPEVPTHIRQPFADYLLPRFWRGDLAVSTQSIDMAGHPEHGPAQAWNLGHALGLGGHATLVPLVLVLIACAAWAWWAVRATGAARSRDHSAPA